MRTAATADVWQRLGLTMLISIRLCAGAEESCRIAAAGLVAVIHF
jgi:hypothetical protein